MKKTQINQEVKNAQEVLNNFLPGLVKVYAEDDQDGGAPRIVGEYVDYKFGGKSTQVERLDRYYSMNIFLSFFQQRKEYMLATPMEQLMYKDHPAMYSNQIK
tara:strand:- start:168 stop:473 length:306 start_codon:yes stop_codon:yes gene_type:complete